MSAWLLLLAGMHTPEPEEWPGIVSDALRYGVYALVAGLLTIVLR